LHTSRKATNLFMLLAATTYIFQSGKGFEVTKKDKVLICCCKVHPPHSHILSNDAIKWHSFNCGQSISVVGHGQKLQLSIFEPLFVTGPAKIGHVG